MTQSTPNGTRPKFGWKSFWDGDFSLCFALEQLVEPVMIIGNRIPDGDSLGSCGAVLDYLRNEGVEAYIHCVVDPDPTLAWMLDDEDTNESILEDYESLVVLDDQVDADRLGIHIKDVPIICVDHHMSNFPDHLRDQIVSNRGGLVHMTDNVIYFHDLKPATACLLIDQGIIHPYLWISLYTDSVGFRVNSAVAITYASKLISMLQLNDGDIEEMSRNLNRIAKPSDFEGLLNGSIFMVEGTLNDAPLSLILACAPATSGIAYKKILTSLNAFSNVVAFVNSDTGKASFRSSTYDFNVMEIAKRFGGGGHVRASGATLDVADLSNQLDKLQLMLISKIDNPTIRHYS